MSDKKKSKAGKGGKADSQHCVSCRNFDADKKGGWCRRRDKKRSSEDKICGHYKPR